MEGLRGKATGDLMVLKEEPQEGGTEVSRMGWQVTVLAAIARLQLLLW